MTLSNSAASMAESTIEDPVVHRELYLPPLDVLVAIPVFQLQPELPVNHPPKATHKRQNVIVQHDEPRVAAPSSSVSAEARQTLDSYTEFGGRK